jgi:hypothetical protein
MKVKKVIFKRNISEVDADLLMLSAREKFELVSNKHTLTMLFPQNLEVLNYVRKNKIPYQIREVER